MTKRYHPEDHFEFFDCDRTWKVEIPDIPREALMFQNMLTPWSGEYSPIMLDHYRSIVWTADFLSEKHFRPTRRKVTGTYQLGLIRPKDIQEVPSNDLDRILTSGMRKWGCTHSKIEHFIAFGWWNYEETDGMISLGTRYREHYASEEKELYPAWSAWDPPGGRQFKLGTEEKFQYHDILVVLR